MPTVQISGQKKLDSLQASTSVIRFSPTSSLDLKKVEEKWQTYEPDEDYFREERAARVVGATSEMVPEPASGNTLSLAAQIESMFDQLR